jgi:hypothetical protein
VIHFRRNILDLARRKTKSALMIFSTLQSSPWGRQNFLAKRFGQTSVDDDSLYCVDRRLSLQSVPPKKHEDPSSS